MTSDEKKSDKGRPVRAGMDDQEEDDVVVSALVILPLL